jgi:hypothetical protein
MSKRDEEAFLQAGDGIREAIKGLPDWDACLALTITLGERIVWGNSQDDGEWECTLPLLRLAQSIHVLGDVVSDIINGDDLGDNDDEDPKRPSPSPDLLFKLLERRRTTKGGTKP